MSRRAKPARNRKHRPPGRRPLVESLERRDLLASYTTPEDTPLIVEDTGMAGVTIQSQPVAGSVTLNSTGGFTYTPHQNFHGSDGFVLARAGDSESLHETVSLTITPVNDAPVISSSPIYHSRYGKGFTTDPNWLGYWVIDRDGDALEKVILSEPQHATLIRNDDGSISYISDPDYFGLDHFDVRVSDGRESVTTTVTIAVECSDCYQLPAAGGSTHNTPQDVPLTIPAQYLVNFGWRNVTASIENPPAHGTLARAADGSYLYTPASGFNGIDSFTYRIHDPANYPWSSGTATGADLEAFKLLMPPTVATVTIRVGTIIGFPSATGETYAVLESGELSVGGPGLLANDTPGYRQEGTPAPQLSAAIHEAPSHGTVTVNADGSFTYRPNPGFVGVDEFRYRVIDPGTNVPPNQYGPYYYPAVGTVRIYVTPVAPPLAIGDDYNVVQDQPLQTTAPYSVLANDVGSGRPLTATLKTGPAHGTLTLQPDGTFTYTPAPGFFGIDSFTYVATDGTTITGNASDLPGFSRTATVTLYVSAAGPEIVARDDFFATAEDTKLDVATHGLLSNDHRLLFLKPEPPNCSLAITNVFRYYPTHVAVLVEGPRHGTLTLKQDGTFEYTPNQGFVGTDAFTYRVRSEIRYGTHTQVTGTSEIATATIQVNPRNHAPKASDDIFRILEGVPVTVTPADGVMANDTPSSATNRVVLVSGPTRGTLTLNPDGSFTYAPGPGFSNYDTFSYRLRDDAAGSGGPFFSNIAYVTLNGVANNLAIGALGERYTTTQDTPLNIGAKGVLENDFQLPRLDSGDFYSYGQLTVLTGCNPYGLSRPTDIPLTVTVVTGPQHGTLTLRPDGSFDYTPEPGFTGIDTFTYQANGAGRFPRLVSLTGLSGTTTYQPLEEPVPHAVATAVIVVRAPGEPPIFLLQDGHETTDESGPQRVAGWAALTIEGAGNSLAPGQRYEVTTDRPELFSQLPGIDSDGSLIYTPAPNVTGTAIVTVKLVGDEGVLSAARSFTINITKPHAFHNTARPLDVDDDEFIVASDALLIINYLNQQQASDNPTTFQAAAYYDVDRDGVITASDALLVIDYLNGQSDGGEGEGLAGSNASESGPTDLLDLLAHDTALQSQRRRRGT